jgi:hypothetical protein
MTAAWQRFTNWPASSGGRRTHLARALATYRRVAAWVYVPVVAALFVVDWSMGSFVDAHAYYRAASDWASMYAIHQANLPDSYMYSPAFAELLGPLAVAGWTAFAAGWFALNAATLWWLARQWALLVLLIPVLYPWSPPASYLPVLTELRVGNIQLLLAAALALSLTRPVAFVLPLLTKPTLGIGLVWYAVRRGEQELDVADPQFRGHRQVGRRIAPRVEHGDQKHQEGPFPGQPPQGRSVQREPSGSEDRPPGDRQRSQEFREGRAVHVGVGQVRLVDGIHRGPVRGGAVVGVSVHEGSHRPVDDEQGHHDRDVDPGGDAPVCREDAREMSAAASS